MKKRCIVDTAVLAIVLIKKLTNRYVLYVPINVMEEVFSRFWCQLLEPLLTDISFMA